MSRIEDYALIGDTHTAALVGRDGSIDWLCLPRFDAPACFAALLGGVEHGRWLLRARDPDATVTRRYRGNTLVLETVFRTATGAVEILDFMPVTTDERRIDVLRIARGLHGAVDVQLELVLRFDYGAVVPWVRRREDGISAMAGPNAVRFRSPVPLVNADFRTTATFPLREGETASFELAWYPSHLEPPAPVDSVRALAETLDGWQAWSRRCRLPGVHGDLAMRSLLTLKALTYAPTGGIVAAPTTSLPERLGGVRNWDYRYCWLRDATFTLYALLISGYRDEAAAWRDWLLRAVAGKPEQLQIMFGIGGERLLFEHELEWLPGYEGSRPVRIGNAAHRQFQLDVYGEVMDVFHVTRRGALDADEDAWMFQRTLLGALERLWREPDESLWEVRGPRRHFTHSKMMAWVAFDRAVKAVERSRLDGPVERWRALRDEIHRDVCARGYDPARGAFTQYYGGRELDAALLMMPLVGFLPATDPRVVSTVDAIRRELSHDGFVRRYVTAPEVDGLPAGEGYFLPCTFWFADTLILQGRRAEGEAVLERALAAVNDVGLLAEEYDPVSRRSLGNFPQAFSHVGLVNTLHNLSLATGPATDRAERPAGR